MARDPSAMFTAWQGLIEAHLAAWQAAFDLALREPQAAVAAFEQAAATTAGLLQDAAAAWGPAGGAAASAQMADVHELAVQIDAIRTRIVLLEGALTAVVGSAPEPAVSGGVKAPAKKAEEGRPAGPKKGAKKASRGKKAGRRAGG
ncbi:MAG: hypothetical protein IT304_08475 [Dehalococcoidia bacterium]|nr:hypothetical protein [Dehalococcoidia bacterium]